MLIQAAIDYILRNDNYIALNKEFYPQMYTTPILNVPTANDIDTLIIAFHKKFSHRMNSDYAYRVAACYLNDSPTVKTVAQ